MSPGQVPYRTPPAVCVLSVYFEGHRAEPLLQNSSSVRQKGGLPGPPTRSPVGEEEEMEGDLEEGG